jgi:hypothetical protein
VKEGENDATHLGIPPVLLDTRLPREPNTSSPLNTQPGRLLRHDGCVPLSHGSLSDKVLALLLHPGGVVSEETSGLDLGSDLGEGELHALEVSDGLAELLALEGVRDGLVEGSLGDADHLGSDTNSSCTHTLRQ